MHFSEVDVEALQEFDLLFNDRGTSVEDNSSFKITDFPFHSAPLDYKPGWKIPDYKGNSPALNIEGVVEHLYKHNHKNARYLTPIEQVQSIKQLYIYMADLQSIFNHKKMIKTLNQKWISRVSLSSKREQEIHGYNP